MEPWTVHDDTPYLRHPSASSTPLARWLAAAMVAAAAAAAGYLYWWQQPEAPRARLAATPPAPQADTGPAPARPPAQRFPEVARSESAPLPTLDNSDSMMRDGLAGLMGRKSFDEMVYPTQLIRRIVATVDNLPRETAPRRVMPLQPVPGVLAATRGTEATTISADNAARYAPYVRVIEALDAHALVQRYVDAYPLFQRAYEELGYPNLYFNDRLLEAIDDLLRAPDLATPIRLVQPKVLYEFEDPDLESRSAGQKILIRMGGANAATLKSKLREIRSELVKAGAAKAQ